MVEGQNDVLPGYTGTHQVFGDPQIRSIVLEPYLTFHDVNVNEHVVNSSLSFPPDWPNLIVAKRIVAHEFRADIRLGRGHFGNFVQHALYNGSVGIVSIHFTIVSVSGSKKISFTSAERRIS
jgi:hypothetical protein